MARIDFKPDMTTTDAQWAAHWRTEVDDLMQENQALITDRNRLREFVEWLLENDRTNDPAWAAIVERAQEALRASRVVDGESAIRFFGLVGHSSASSGQGLGHNSAASA